MGPARSSSRPCEARGKVLGRSGAPGGTLVVKVSVGLVGGQHFEERRERRRWRDEKRENPIGGTATAGVPVTAIVVSSLISPLSIGASLISHRRDMASPGPRSAPVRRFTGNKL